VRLCQIWGAKYVPAVVLGHPDPALGSFSQLCEVEFKKLREARFLGSISREILKKSR